MPKKGERINARPVGQFLRRQRNLRNLSQKEVADRIGIKQGQISKLESGETLTIPLDDVEKYAKGVGSSRLAVLRAIKHPSVEEAGDLVTEEATAIAEAFTGYQSEAAKEIVRQALAYADQVERGAIIGGNRAE